MRDSDLSNLAVEHGWTPELVRSEPFLHLVARTGNGRLVAFRFRDDLAYLTTYPPSATYQPGWGVSETPAPSAVSHVEDVTGDPEASDLSPEHTRSLLERLLAAQSAPSATNPVFGKHPRAIRCLLVDEPEPEPAEEETP